MSEDVPLAPPTYGPSHYYGDIVRILFICAAVLIILSHFVSEPFLTPFASLISAVVLVIAAGLTNPVQAWIQWLNTLISAGALLLFGSIGFTRYEETQSLVGNASIAIILTVIFIFALYLSVKNTRGLHMRNAPIIK
jgi:hypothetical protein